MKYLSVLSLLLLPILLQNCAPQKPIAETSSNVSAKLESIAAYSPVYPVLIGKKSNPILRIELRVKKERSPLKLEALEFSLAGTTRLKDIHEAKLFYTGDSPVFSDEQKFGLPQAAQKKITFSGEQILKEGLNYFWLSFQLTGKADLLNKIGASGLSATIEGETIGAADTFPAPLKRIGRALRQHMDDKVHTYRIPGIATTNNRTLISVYDIRRNGSVDLQEDVDVGMNRSADGGQNWEPMKVIMDMGEWGGKPQNQNGIGDPAILVDRETNTIWVAGVWAHGSPGERNWRASKPGIEPKQTSQLMLTKSEDDGLTWSEPINITAMVKDPKWYLLLQGPGKGITMSDGTLVFPAQYKDENQVPHATILYSKDRGKTWKLGKGAKSKTTESQVVELSDGSLMLNMRDDRGSGSQGRNGTGARSVAITTDLGQTWVEHPTSRKALPEPVCNASLIRHSYTENGMQKDVLIFVNPNDRYQRRNMTIKLSFDEGASWPEKYHTLIDEGQGRGYPSLTSIDENAIGLLYEGSQADLVFQKISLQELMKK